MDGGDGNRRDPGSATRPIVSIAAIVFGGLGIAFQQLSTGQPQSVGRWLMLAVGSLIGGAVGILATGLFDRLLAWATTGWERFRERAQARTVLLAVLVCLATVGVGFATPPVLAGAHRWLNGCPHPTELRVLTAPDGVDGFRKLARDYEQSTAAANHDCPGVSVYVYAAAPGAARTALATGWPIDALRDLGPRPDVWLPDSSLEVDDVASDAKRYANVLPVADSWPMASSPVVLGMPATAVPEAMATGRRNLSWTQVLSRVDELGWGLGRPDPTVSVVGQLATTAMYVSAAGGPGRMPDPVRARGIEQRIERSLDKGSYPLGDSAALLCRQRRGDAPPTAIVTTEQALVRFNQGYPLGGECGIGQPPPSPEARLLAFYPPDTLGLDHPFIRFGWGDPADPQTAAATAFGRWLRSGQGKEALLRIALRPTGPFEITDPLTENNGAAPGAAFVRTPPPRELRSQTSVRYDAARRPGRVLLAVDASGSLGERAATTGTRFEVATRAIQQSLRLMSDRDEFGLWVFPADAEGRGTRQLVPIGRGDATADGLPRREAAVAALGRVTPAGGTPLHRTIVDGVRAVGPTGEDRVTALVVVTDGEDTSSGLTPAQVTAAVRDKQVRVLVIAVGEAHCSAQALTDVTAGTGGACYEPGLDSVDDVLVELFCALWKGGGASG